MQIFTNPKNGETISTEMLRSDARLMIQSYAPASDVFAHDLARKTSLSQGQEFWLMKKGFQYNPFVEKPKATGIQVGKGFARLSEMFATAKQSLKRPKISLQDLLGNAVQLSLAADTSKNPGFIYIKSNKEYAGKISPMGEFFPIRSCPDSVKNYLKDFSENPEMVAREYGRTTGHCCFCSKLLTDNRSVSVGYGPICADKFGLAWGIENKLKKILTG